MKIELGQPVKDIITGFKGITTGRVEYLTGCTQFLVVPPAKDGKVMDGNWFDEQRLQPTGGKIVKLNNDETPGFDMEAPKY